MKKKKILLMAPVMPATEHSQELVKSLSFLSSSYDFHVIDPLSELSNLDNETYYRHWQTRLEPLVDTHDVFIGFSFGAVILQRCFSFLIKENIADKPILLFSAPSFADNALKEKLGKVVALAKQIKLQAAYQLLMQQVLYPAPPKEVSIAADDPALACARLVEGLSRVLTTDLRDTLANNDLRYHHFIGEHSYLVNQHNVVTSKSGTLITVPNAGMRVLQDNAAFCHKKIAGILAWDVRQ